MSADLAAVVAAAHRDGRATLTEPESYAVAARLGLVVPTHLVVADPSEIDETALERFRGAEVVVKVVSADLVHKAAVGAVRIVERRRGAVAEAAAAVLAAAAGYRPSGCLVAERVAVAGPELMLGLRRTQGFGPILTMGVGGRLAEASAAEAPPAVLPVPCDAGTIARVVNPGWFGDPDRVIGWLAGVVEAASGLPGEVAELDLNPVVETAAGLMALDAFCRLGTTPAPPPGRAAGALDVAFRPATIGVIGVSSGENPGRAVLRNVLGAGFPPDRVVVVKPGTGRIDGVRCVESPADLGGGVDLLVVAVSAPAAAGVVEEVAAAGLARAVVLIPGGLGEREGSEGLAERVRAALRRAGAEGRAPLVFGGNCMGIRSVPGRYDTTFIPPERLAAPPDAPVAPLAVISQSGALAIARLDRFPGLRPRYLVTVGNQVDVTVGEVLDHVSRDPEIEVAACYVEGFRPGDGTRFLEAARRLRDRGGTVVLALGGTTGPGRASAASHTASIATDTRVAAALAGHAGVLVASGFDEFEDLVRLALSLGRRRIGGLRLGAVTNAGFEAVAIADALGGLRLAEFAPATREMLDAVLRDAGVGGVVAAGNPLDLTPITGDTGYGRAVQAVLDDPGVDLAVVACVPLTPAVQAGAGEPGDGSVGSILSGLASHPTPWIAVIDAGAGYDGLRGTLEEAGLAVFGTADRAVRALARYVAGRSRHDAGR